MEVRDRLFCCFIDLRIKSLFTSFTVQKCDTQRFLAVHATSGISVLHHQNLEPVVLYSFVHPSVGAKLMAAA